MLCSLLAASLTLGYGKILKVDLVFNVVIQVTVRMLTMPGPRAKPQDILLETSKEWLLIY